MEIKRQIIFLLLIILIISVFTIFFPFPTCRESTFYKLQECNCIGIEKPITKLVDSTQCVGIPLEYACYRQRINRDKFNQIPCELLPVDKYTLEIYATEGVRFSGWIENDTRKTPYIEFDDIGIGIDKKIVYESIGTKEQGLRVRIFKKDSIGSIGTLIARLRDSNGNLLNEINSTSRDQGLSLQVFD